MFDRKGEVFLAEIVLKKITDLSGENLTEIWLESRKEGFHFIGRLIKEYEDGANCFSLPGECLFGVYRGKDLIGIGGINQDPHDTSKKIGRVRRFYISPLYRRTGAGSMLLGRLKREAEVHFETLLLHTDTERGALFYEANGFRKAKGQVKATHFLSLADTVRILK
ncbi:GNAT family N-acetyltransferase [Peribacillus sp. SCS-37]|uniref:GNAT family N-acetyltransferase n=1 Tax=Paraperibacillus esterisolvens TaxID=3115296 RepID=UPI003905FA9B